MGCIFHYNYKNKEVNNEKAFFGVICGGLGTVIGNM